MQTNTHSITSDALIKTDSNDEFKTLAIIYNQMLERLHKLIDTVYVKEILAKDAQLKSLQEQITPHFLYNTLECVMSLVDLHRDEEAKKTIISLSNLMRMAINATTFTSIRVMKNYLNQYIYIQKERFQNKILFLMEIPSSMDRYNVPTLLLQPLLENSVVHGVSDVTYQGMIEIVGKETDDKLIFEVIDNGEGTPQSIIDELSSKKYVNEDNPGNHIGIFNIQKRLELIYENNYSFTISPVLPTGSLVTVIIPKEENHENIISR